MGFAVSPTFPSCLIPLVMFVLLYEQPYSNNQSSTSSRTAPKTITAFSIKPPKLLVVPWTNRIIRRGVFQPCGCTSSRSRRNTAKDATVLAEDDGTLSSIERIFVLSDLHTDHGRNMDWVHQRCTHPNGNTPGSKDALLIAGDISHDLDILKKTFDVLQNNLQCSIFFIPGNHEAWMERSKNYTNSFDKLDAVIQLCQQMGIYTTHCLVGTNHKCPAWVVPIHSWYDGSLILPDCEELIHDFPSWPWADFTRCQWPKEHIISNNTAISSSVDSYWHRNFPMTSLVDAFLKKNEAAIADIRRSQLPDEKKTVGLVTFSHFLPNQQSLPDWKDLQEESFQKKWLDHPGPGLSAKFALVGGSKSIDEQIRSISSDMYEHIHVLGHSHRPKDFFYKGVRYIHHPLGKPVEREMQMISPNVDFKCIWDTTTTSGSVPSSQILRYWEEQGGGLVSLRAFMKPRKSFSQPIAVANHSIIPEKDQRTHHLTASAVIAGGGHSNSISMRNSSKL